jgi:hypothetical protein
MRKNMYLWMILAFLVWNCKSNDDEPMLGTIQGTVEATTGETIAGARIIVFDAVTNLPVTTLISAADGKYSTQIAPGNYYLKIYAQGFENVPPRMIAPVSFAINLNQTTEFPVQMNSSLTNGGWLKGKVLASGKGVPGSLVVAIDGETAFSTVSDHEGNYFLYNLPAATYQLKAWMGGYASETKSVNITIEQEATKDIPMTMSEGGTVNGRVAFLASTAIEVDVTLVHPVTKESIPGLSTTTTGDYSIAKVPAGTYLARATFKNDQRVVDPDWIVKFGEPWVEVNNNTVVRDFSLTGSVTLGQPCNAPTSSEAFEINNGAPSFEWTAYPSASDYVIEVTDANGNLIWGGFTVTGNTWTKNIVIPSAQTSITFNSDGKAVSNLLPGKTYRWKIYASKNDNQAANGWRLISVSEDQLGLIKLKAE